MRTVGHAISSRNNNFDVLRLFAALLVLWGHSYPLTADGKDDVFTKALFGYDMAGSFAVLIFFIISGFLVTKSASERTIEQYLAARSLRILPGLTCAVVATVFVIGPLMTKLSLLGYFQEPFTMSYLRNIFVFGLQYDIPAATSGLPYAGSINSSLWTLSLECGFYVIVAALFHFTLFTERRAWIIIAAIGLLNLYCIYVIGLNFDHQGPTIWKGATLSEVAKNGSAFFLGGALWVYRNRVVLNAGAAIVCAIALFAAAGTSSAAFVYSLAVPYLVIYFALGLPFKVNMRRIGDLSYATYLIAFPVQQAVIALCPGISATAVSLIATPIVLTVAYFSWWFVEKPFLALKGRDLSSLARNTVADRDALQDAAIERGLR